MKRGLRDFYAALMQTGMPDKSQDYQRRAKEAEQKAREASGDDAKTSWLNIARHWRLMAEQAERNEW